MYIYAPWKVANFIKWCVRKEWGYFWMRSYEQTRLKGWFFKEGCVTSFEKSSFNEYFFVWALPEIPRPGRRSADASKFHENVGFLKKNNVKLVLIITFLNRHRLSSDFEGFIFSRSYISGPNLRSLRGDLVCKLELELELELFFCKSVV